MNTNKNWEGFTNLGHSNWTLRFPRQATGGYAPHSEKPKCGWCLPIALGIGFMAVLMLAPHFFF